MTPASRFPEIISEPGGRDPCKKYTGRPSINYFFKVKSQQLISTPTTSMQRLFKDETAQAALSLDCFAILIIISAIYFCGAS